MISAEQRQLTSLLEQVAKALDIPDELFEEAVSKYEDVGNWLEEQDQNHGRREPQIYPQGSFRVGTVVRPISEKDEYDIDLVYERDLRKSSTSQEQLEEETGEHLAVYVRYCKEAHRDVPSLASGRRCWTLNYPDHFHMDLLPAIPDDEGRLGFTPQCATRILVTDRDLREWQHSNPIGYAEWFKSRMAIQFREKRAALAAEMAKAAAEDVPEYKVKTPLQRAIQILKRHRDFHFQNDKDDRPVSIILTTLAAKAYNNQEDLVDALVTMVREMPNHIETRIEAGKRVSWVPNPVNDDENFADKWKEHPERETKFRAWLKKVDDDLTAALRGGGIHRVVDLLGISLRRSAVTKAAAAIGHSTLRQRQAGSLKMASGTGMLGAVGNASVKEHTFYGVDKEKAD
ncbi:MAG: nucleotidyltransferase [bacterium]